MSAEPATGPTAGAGEAPAAQRPAAVEPPVGSLPAAPAGAGTGQPPPRFVFAEEIEEFFWRSGADGVLRFLGCAACGRIHHPPVPRCPHCGSRDVAPTAVSGRATVATYTVNHQPFMPGFEPPYVIAVVEVAEDPTVRLTTNLLDCTIDEVHIGMEVEVAFERNGDWFVPLFRPRRDGQGAAASSGDHISERTNP